MKRVVVIGAGVAGCAAAVAAAEAGAEVTLLDAAQHCGGVAAQGEHRSICGLAPVDAPTESLLEHDLTAPWIKVIATAPAWRQGRVWLWPTSAERLQAGCLERLRLAGVVVRLGEPVTALPCADQRVTAVQTIAGLYPCDAWIDASGGAAIAARCGAATRPPRAWGAWRGLLALELPPGSAARTRALRVIAEAMAVPVATALTPIAPGRWQLSLDMAPGSDAAAANELAQRAAAALGAVLLAGGCHVAERDSGGWSGTLDAETLFATAERGWCWAAWPVEAHGAAGVTWRWPSRDRHGIPVEATRPAVGSANGAVIGRGMPVAADAIAALRVIGTQLALGTAVGRAQALSTG